MSNSEQTSNAFPPKQGLYDPHFEKDSCGVGMVAHVLGNRTHGIVAQALEVLRNLHHRGAQGSDPLTGDGAGILTQIPHGFFSAEAQASGWTLPESGDYGVGMVFIPRDAKVSHSIAELIEQVIVKKGARLLGWRDVPVDNSTIGEQARQAEPVIRQFFIEKEGLDEMAFERRLYVLRRAIEKAVQGTFASNMSEFHIPSLSSRTIIYKGLLLPAQVSQYYRDLTDSRFESGLALVHSRFSTNTFPSWPRAHPYRYLCHNGEINTIQGNVNWMRARQGRLKSELFGSDISKVFPIIEDGQSDSACLDNALEFLYLGGRSIAHAMMMLIPEPWVANPQMDLSRRAFYQFHSAMMEPWDGPAAVCFTDGRTIGATLDRNGLRPCRYQITDDQIVTLASETGVFPVSPAKIIKKGRLEPGRMFLVDTVLGRILNDEEVKTEMAARKPYRNWVTANRVTLDELPEPANVPQPDHASLRQRQQAFGITIEELKMILTPMAVTGEEPVSSMGNDTPMAVLSRRPQLLFKYFRQSFAQVTNPPIDPIRERIVMSLGTHIGPRPNLLSENPEAWKQIQVKQPVLTNEDMAKIRAIADPSFRSITLKLLFPAADGARGLRQALIELCRQASKAVQEGVRFIVLSDRGVNETWAPMPSLLGISAVHHHLVRKSQRAECGLILETGEPRDVHHFACLIGFGAGSINPYLAFETLTDMARDGYLPEGIDSATAHAKFIQAVGKGLLKIFSKMGISTIQSYCGAQIFEAIGLKSELINKYFTGTPSRIEGIGLEQIAEETLIRHGDAFVLKHPTRLLDLGGDIHYRAQGEHHEWNPETISLLQHATKSGDPRTFAEFSARVNESDTTLRSLLKFNFAATPIPLDQVEAATEIVKRFTTGAMSFGALSKEAHETLAIAMNRMGAKSNSGEGGEDAERFTRLPNGDLKNSAIKQIASARFGVTAHYLVNARELQIKMAQGAKPGEGGQLPGLKVDAMIARLRYCTPGVTLISPPPHHDIYSIEDLAQLIFDLKNVNPKADISVKLVAEIGVGTVAAGVAKTHADKILISGDSGGTGASPLSSIKYAGIPWELGLAEAHQTLVLSGLRNRVKLETDGQLKTGRDVVVAALLGAEEFGFATAPLITQGCIMMRKCHLNTCPVGVATQDPELRLKFKGQPEHLINYFFFIAEEVRALMSKLGISRFEDLVGRTDKLLTTQATQHWKATGLDLASLLHQTIKDAPRSDLRFGGRRPRNLDTVLDQTLLRHCLPALEHQQKVVLEYPIRNTDRATGSMLSGRVAEAYGATGLPDNTIQIQFKGSAGQSFGAFLAGGITLKLEGESNDYIGKGLSGGRIIVLPPHDAAYPADESILIGNTSLYGATGGEAYFRGLAGERFAVRNSGAHAVVEGTGDHGCEYMTGGRVVVLGRTGRNFAAGMSGGIAYVFDDEGTFPSRCNQNLVELGPVTEDEDLMTLRHLLKQHQEFTRSPKAAKIISNWNELLPKFVRVMPTEYKRAREASRV